MDPHALVLLLESWGYPVLFVLFILTGVGSPIPEDLLLLTAGYLTFAGVFEWPFVIILSVCGVVGSDLMLYVAGRHLAWHSSRWPDGHFLSPARLCRATRWFDRWGHALVLMARLTPGTRAVVFVTAGVRSVPIGSFAGYDTLGALVWVPSMLALGHAAGRRIGDIAQLVDWFERGALWVLVIAAALLVSWLTLGREESKL